MPKQIVITGMHRSGTSLVASLLQRAGVNIGDKLQGSSTGNLRGHFEDSDFYNFHEEILRRWGLSVFVQSLEDLGNINELEAAKAQVLLEQHQAKEVWGWKDPRTSLFLNFWHSRLSNPRYLFLYRHPLEVLLSLLRRGTDVEVMSDPAVALCTWAAYNQNILAFYQQYPELCLLCHISGVTSNIETFIHLLSEKFELPLKTAAVLSIYQPDELQQGFVSAEADQVLSDLFPAVADLYRQLESQAHLFGHQTNQLSTSQIRQLSDHLRVASESAGSQTLTMESRNDRLLSLLQILDPQAIKMTIFALQGHLTGKGVHIQQLEAHIQQLEIAIRHQATHTQQQDAAIQHQATHIQQLEAAIQQQQVNIQQQETVIQQQAAQVQQQDNIIQQQTVRLQQLEAALETVHQTRIWRLAQQYWRLRRKILTSFGRL